MKNRQVTKIVILMTASRFDVVSSDVGRCVTAPLTDAEKHCKVAKEYCRSVANVRTLSAKHNVIQFICVHQGRCHQLGLLLQTVSDNVLAALVVAVVVVVVVVTYTHSVFISNSIAHM